MILRWRYQVHIQLCGSAGSRSGMGEVISIVIVGLTYIEGKCKMKIKSYEVDC